ncbi:MAG: hypothetical protein HYT42_02280 [Candidatus Sungbacteria bacterium]|nr:hypothetical protein [Candidatus Sungbacteria bacterium]
MKQVAAKIGMAATAALIIAGPWLVLAQTDPPTTGSPTTCGAVRTIFNNIATFGQGIIFTVSAVVLVIGAFFLVTSGGNEDNLKRGKDFVLYAVIGIIVGLAAFGLPKLVETVTGISAANCAT